MIYFLAMRYIELTQNKRAIVDDDDYEYVNQFKWCVYKSSSGKYYASRNNSRKSKEGKYLIKMHRYILRLHKRDGHHVDHENGNTLDNQKSNLRIVTNQQNSFNRKEQSNNKSGYKGVYKHSQYDKWVAQIKIGDKRYHIGVFDTPELAALSYNEYAQEHHGQYGYKNTVKAN